MRVLHIVTLVSANGAFGGPLRVALNDCKQLQERGHTVLIAAGWRGDGQPPTSLEGVPTRLFPVHQLLPRTGFSGLVSPGLQRWLRREAEFVDAVHVHLGRDLITQRASRRLRDVPYVVQTHGMIPPKGDPVAGLWDRALTRRSLANARRRYVLNRREASEMEVQFPQLSFELLPNGVENAEPASEVASNAVPEVLFVARMQTRKRPGAFVDMARLLIERGTSASFAMIGPDEGELDGTLAHITDAELSAHIKYEGALSYSEVLKRMRRASVYVLPSVDEPFPMTLLEAMSVGLPCVTTSSCGIADQLQELEAAVVVEPDAEALAEAVHSLLEDGARRERLGTAARRAVEERFSISAVVDRLERDYAELNRAASR